VGISDARRCYSDRRYPRNYCDWRETLICVGGAGAPGGVILSGEYGELEGKHLGWQHRELAERQLCVAHGNRRGKHLGWHTGKLAERQLWVAHREPEGQTPRVAHRELGGATATP